MTEAKPKNKTTMIIIGVALALTVLCLIACVVSFFVFGRVMSNTIKLDPAEAKTAAAEITEYDVPAGYKEFMATSTLGLKMAALVGENPKNMIWLAQTATDDQWFRPGYLLAKSHHL